MEENTLIVKIKLNKEYINSILQIIENITIVNDAELLEIYED